jgi:hypothetical protein
VFEHDPRVASGRLVKHGKDIVLADVVEAPPRAN